MLVEVFEVLLAWGVDTVFGLPGDGINGIIESLRKAQGRIRFIQVRQEEAAAFMACGYANYTRRPGVCLSTSGPGGIHLLNGLYASKKSCRNVPPAAGVSVQVSRPTKLVAEPCGQFGS